MDYLLESEGLRFREEINYKLALLEDRLRVRRHQAAHSLHHYDEPTRIQLANVYDILNKTIQSQVNLQAELQILKEDLIGKSLLARPATSNRPVQYSPNDRQLGRLADSYIQRAEDSSRLVQREARLLSRGARAQVDQQQLLKRELRLKIQRELQAQRDQLRKLRRSSLDQKDPYLAGTSPFKNQKLQMLSKTQHLFKQGFGQPDPSRYSRQLNQSSPSRSRDLQLEKEMYGKQPRQRGDYDRIRAQGRLGDEQFSKGVQPSQNIYKQPGLQRNQKDQRNYKDLRYQGSQKEQRDQRFQRDQKDQRDQRFQRDQKDQRDQRDQRNLSSQKDQREQRNQRDLRDHRDQRDLRSQWGQRNQIEQRGQKGQSDQIQQRSQRGQSEYRPSKRLQVIRTRHPSQKNNQEAGSYNRYYEGQKKADYRIRVTSPEQELVQSQSGRRGEERERVDYREREKGDGRDEYAEQRRRQKLARSNPDQTPYNYLKSQQRASNPPTQHRYRNQAQQEARTPKSRQQQSVNSRPHHRASFGNNLQKPESKSSQGQLSPWQLKPKLGSQEQMEQTVSPIRKIGHLKSGNQAEASASNNGPNNFTPAMSRPKSILVHKEENREYPQSLLNSKSHQKQSKDKNIQKDCSFSGQKQDKSRSRSRSRSLKTFKVSDRAKKNVMDLLADTMRREDQFKDSKYRNVKHQLQHLRQTYELQRKIRGELIQKIVAIAQKRRPR